jgi:hypothetical protein
MKKVNVSKVDNSVNHETLTLMKQLKALQQQLQVYEAIKKEADRIKERLKSLYPEGVTLIHGNDILTVERRFTTRYNIPEDLKPKLACQIPVYFISVRSIKKE